MPDPTYDDATGGLSLDAFDLGPDLGSLSYPWDPPPPAPAETPAAAPPPPDATPPQLEPTQPGLGIPVSTLDAFVPPAPSSSEPPPLPAEVTAAPADPGSWTPESAAPSGAPAIDSTYGYYTGAAQGSTLTPEQQWQEAERRYQQVAGEYQRNPGKLLDRLLTAGPDAPIDADTQRYLNEFKKRDPEGEAELETRMGDAQLKYMAAKRQEIENANHDRQIENAQFRDKTRAEIRQKSEAIDAEAQRIADTKIGYHPTTLQRIAGVIAAVVGGLYQGRTGSARNPGLDALNEVINRDLQEQHFNLVNRRDVLGMRKSVLAEQYARTGDMYEAAEVKRLADLKHADELLAQEQLKFAPDGMRALRIAGIRTGIAGQIAANKQARDQKLFDNSMKLQNASREQQLADETARHNRVGEGIEYGKLQLEKDKESGKDGPTFTPEQWAMIHPDNPVPPVAYNSKEYKAFLDQRKTGGEIANQAPVTQRGVPGVTVPDPKTGKDTTFIATGEPSEVAKLRTKKAASVTIVHLLDNALRIRDGYSNNNVADRAQWQQLQQIWGAAKAKGKDSLGLGALSADDYKLLDGYLGTSDPTSFRDPTKGIEQARRTVLLDLNDSLHASGFPEDRHFDVPDTSKPAKPRDTVNDRMLKMLLDDPENVAKSQYDPTGAPRPARGDSEPFPEQKTRFRGDTANQRPDYHGHGILLQRQGLDEVASRARDPNAPDHDEAITMIADVAAREGGGRGAVTAEVRDYARQLLYGPDGIIAAGINAIPSAGGQ
ncbi:MAG: hypothetical protein ABR520_11290 [Mycobacteriales bacterium]|nr:hypothetical protein [Actinomycetota bacterium]